MSDPREVFQRARHRSRIAIEIWPWMVGAVALLILPEIAVRRLGGGAVGWMGRLVRRRASAAATGTGGHHA